MSPKIEARKREKVNLLIKSMQPTLKLLLLSLTNKKLEFFSNGDIKIICKQSFKNLHITKNWVYSLFMSY